MFTKDPLFQASTLPHSPHVLIPQLIAENTSVLDVGCNTGFLGKGLLEKQVETDGIDINQKALKIADKYYRQVFNRDLYKNMLDIPVNKYDYIVFGDILEHVPRPDLLLIDSHKYLKKTGKVIASMPNIARIENRIKLLFGKFEYAPGIISPDHIRFFTKRTSEDLFIKCGYKVEQVIPTGLGHSLRWFQTLTAFQFILVAGKSKV